MNNTISQLSTRNLYVAHSARKEQLKKETAKEPQTAPVVIETQPRAYQNHSRSYYYDSVGGGYQGL